MRIATRISLLFLFLLPGLLLQPYRGQSATPPLVVSTIDVGQGDSILVQFPTGKNMLVDAGDGDHGDDVVQYLRSRKVARIDVLVATHPHEDHIGGMADVLRSFPVGKVWDSGYAHGSRTQAAFLQTIKAKQIRFGTPRAGFTQDIGKAKVEVLAPVRLLAGTDSDANNNSIVMKVSYGTTSFLLTGDMEEAERATVPTWPTANVLKVAHHGSHNGTDAAFLKTVKPQYAVISYAPDNEYGHPHAETRQALQAAGVKVSGTGALGTVVITSDGKALTVKSLGKQGAASNQSGGGQYIGNRNSHIFHQPSCSTLPNPENRVYINSREEAIRAGYRPCKRCKP